MPFYYVRPDGTKQLLGFKVETEMYSALDSAALHLAHVTPLKAIREGIVLLIDDQGNAVEMWRGAIDGISADGYSPFNVPTFSIDLINPSHTTLSKE